MDTIIALSSGALPSGVAIVRCSGPHSSQVLSLIGSVPKQPRLAEMQVLRDFERQPIDQSLVIWFPAPASFTGEDVVEFQVHGSRAVVSKLLEVATNIDNVRLAEPGEFARRAFANGKIDLTEAEGLADLIEAETEAQRKVAHFLASGGLRDLYNGWQDMLLNARALIEADIDFSDEDDVPGSVADAVWEDVQTLHDEICAHVKAYGRSEKIRNGVRISLIGKPNVGKSSLLNALAGTDRAIVSEVAGTTRDVVEVRLNLGGYLVLLSDTAGIRESAEAIESEGIRRSIEAANTSDLILYLSDEASWPDLGFKGNAALVRVLSKVDENPVMSDASDETVSVIGSDSLESFVESLAGRVVALFPSSLAESGIRLRYLDHLNQCIESLEHTKKEHQPLELRAEHLRSAAYSLGRITGQHDTEDVLGRIFSSFCIGK